MNLIVRGATKAERRDYCCQIPDALIVAVDIHGVVVGYCEYKNDTIFLIESFLPGAGRMLIESLPQCIYAADVVSTAHGFWTKMGFEPFDGKTWRRTIRVSDLSA
jgi:hypothetical protein